MDPNRHARRPCHSFQRTGSCGYGQKCKFSHDLSDNHQKQRRHHHRNHNNDRPEQESQQVMGGNKLRAWKRILARGEESSNVPYDTVSLFFELSLALMEGDIAISQEAVKLLAGDAGLNFIKAVSSTHIVQAAAATDADSSSIRVELWKTQISPMFRLITNERLLDSNVLEQEVAAIYSFLVGVNATRMDRLFGFITQLVMDWPGLPVGDLAQGTVLELSLTVLSKVLDCNTTNVLNERFHHIVEQFSNILTTLSATPGEKNDEACILRATKYLDYLQRRLGVGKTMMATANLAESSPATAGDPAGPSESFKLRRDLPGKLSPDGPRHDNDHAEIASIQIMPTSEEITSPRKEYLPTTDSSQWHLPGIRGRLDREFRLLREDTVGQLRDAVFELLQGTRDNINSNKRHNQNSAQTTAYDDAVVHSVDIDKNNGLELTVRCSQPKIVQKMSDAARNRWWEQCKRLQAGALTCVIDRAGAAQFYVVARSTVRSASQKETSARKRGEPSSPPPFYQEEDKEKPLSLSYSREDLFVKLNLVGTSRVEMQQTLRWYKDIGRPRPRQLVEFPGVLLASFKHTLEALQKLSRKPDLPFTHLIAPDTPSSSPPPLRRVESRVAPPLFSRAAGFEYDLKCLNSGGLSPLSVRPGQHMPSIEEVSENTGLDETQSEALLNTLTRELSLIQGPPGTGKSYTGEKIIRVLLANKAKAKLGPIICVCYTNHALDQLLEHLLDDGIKGILRIGSSSKSERLKNFNLRAVADKSAVAATRTETYIIGGQTRKMRTAETEMKKCLRTLDQCDSASSMGNYLEMNHPVFHKELFGPAADDGSRGDVLSGGGQWETVTRRSKPGKVVETWLRGGSRPPPPGPGHNHNNNPPPRDLADLQRTRLNDMTHLERQIIHREWQKSIRNPVFKEIMALHREHEEARTFRNTIRDEEDLRCLQQADIIGLTTTGLARQVDMMRKVRAKVVICEEAGEVLEAHVLTALLPSVEQLILIGDHLQLRPQIQNYDLQSTNPKGLKYSLDTSLFERLVCPQHSEDQKLPVSVLATQRRMHPSIAEMVRSTLYSNLKDASHVESYPEVVGMDRRLFWLHHEHLEDGQHAKGGEPHDTSRSNEFEVEMAAALVSHVVKQGNYDPEDIAVLTPYTGQLQKLRRRLATEASFCVQIDERDLQALDEEGLNEAEEETKAVATTVGKSTLLKSIRLATVDNFQGEEAKVVIISLVRSNMENRCGFLSTSNRINVLLSRAKHGCYILGNAKTYQSVAMWEQVIKLLQANDNFGTALALKCPRHPATRIEVSSPDDFAIFSPDGGCRLPCDRRLDCGHACYGRCHSDLLHQAIKCHKPCPRPKDGCYHACPKECGDPCEEKCNVVLRSLSLALPRCDHTVTSAKCWETQNPAAIKCRQEVERVIPGCAHTVKMQCHIDITRPGFKCPAQCGAVLPCGHTCRRPCVQCNRREVEDDHLSKIATDHGPCRQACGRNYSTCPHSCIATCHGQQKCPPCPKPCEVRCSHSRCSKACHEPCTPCAAEDCASRCPHSRCTMPCAAPCDWVPCSRRCPLTLACGHQCPSLCGEACPAEEYCQQCGADDILATVVDYLLLSEYKDIDLNDDPCVFASCGHFLTRSSMDGQMLMGEHYVLDDKDGGPVAIRKPLEPFSMDGRSQLKTCPQCRGSLRDIPRYGRIVRRALLDEATKKFISWSEHQHHQLAGRLLDLQNNLAAQQQEQNGEKGKGDAAAAAEDIAAQILDYMPGRFALKGSAQDQLRELGKWVGKKRYTELIRLHRDIVTFRGRVRAEEQPFQKVANLVRFANSNKTVDSSSSSSSSSFTFDSSVIQLRGFLLATSLLLRCHLTVLSDFLDLRTKKDTASCAWKHADISVDFARNTAQCEDLVRLASETDRPQLQAEGHIYHAHFCGLALALGNGNGNSNGSGDDKNNNNNSSSSSSNSSSSSSSSSSSPSAGDEENILKTTGLEHIAAAQTILDKRSPQPHWAATVQAELDAVRDLLSQGIFYTRVTAAEMRAVYKAMAAEFRGTGHWYTCERGHPFTVGECGMPMEQARCPECGAAVGGRNHVAVEGVRHAVEVEALARGVEGMAI